MIVFCGDQLLCVYLRPSNIDGAKHVRAITKLLVEAIRKRWPDVKITIRADSGFCRWRLMRWCDKHDVSYILGVAGNKVLERRVLMKAERLPARPNTRFVVTNLTQTPQSLYDEIYVQRGEMENRIKEQQLMLFADRASCQDFLANQFRLLLSSFAYVLVETLRREHLDGTDLAQAQVDTIRLKLLKVAARVITSVRRVVLHFSSSYPGQDLFRRVVASLMGAPQAHPSPG